MERRVGEIFEYKGKKLKVVETPFSCYGCYFLTDYYLEGKTALEQENNCARYPCLPSNREDGKEVIFQLVK